jgi:HKD family nuclease
MKISFLWQGLENSTESVGIVLLDSLLDTAFSEFDCLSAFVSLSGITGLAEAIEKSKQHIQKFRVVVGIDQDGTSKEALEALLRLDIGVLIYYTFSPITYHPKVYMFKGDTKCSIIVGSSNLTKQGLFQNVEASLKVDFAFPDKDGEAFLAQVNSYLESFLNGKMRNLQKLTPDLIKQLFESGTIPDEVQRAKIQENKAPIQKDQKETNDLDKLKGLFPTIELQKVPDSFKPTMPEKKEKVEMIPTIQVAPQIPPTVVLKPVTPPNPWTIKGGFLWSKILTRSDALQVRPGTNPTGGLRLTQADHAIDQTTYFRQNIFGKLVWTVEKTTPFVEVANVQCYVKILGRDTGIHRLTLRHKPSGEAGQGNYTTLLSWGTFGIEITKTNLAGRTLNLYAPPPAQNEPFYIDIT